MSALTGWLIGLAVALAIWVGAVLVQLRRIEQRYPPLGRKVVVEPGTALQVLEEGDGPLVLLIHGAASNLRELPSALNGHLAGLRMIAVDRPGFGWSDRGEAGRAWQLGEQARLIGLLLDQLGTGPVVVAGHSWGSAVGLRLALDRPDLVRGLVLIAPASHPWPGGTALVNRLGAMPVIGPLLAFFLPPLLGPVLAPSGIKRAFAPGPPLAGYGDQIGTPLHFRPASFVHNCEDMAFGNAELAAQCPRYPGLTVPAAIISGASDLIVSNQIHAKQLARDLPHASSLRVENGGHMPHWVDPAAVAAAIRAMV